MAKQETEEIALPIEAQKKVNELKAQMFAIQNQLQMFVDGVLLGMGIDIQSNPKVDLDAMTILLPKEGGDEPALKE